MKAQIHKNVRKEVRTKPEEVVKLPYQKPELHELNLVGTEGKTATSSKEFTTLGGTSYGPS